MSKPKSGKGEEHEQPIPTHQHQPAESFFKLKLVVSMLTHVVAVGIAWGSFTFYSSIKDHLFFSEAKIKRLDSQIDLLTQIAFYFSIFVLVNWTILFLLKSFCNRTGECVVVAALRRNISSSIQQFVIFAGLYGYLLTKGGLGFKKKQLVLLANWFLLSRILFAVGSLVDAKTKFNFRQMGSALNAITAVIILCNAAGYNGFTYF